MKPARSRSCASFHILLLAACRLSAADYPPPAAGDFTIRDFWFLSGEVLKEARMHYLTLGTPRRDDKGVMRNAVLILHGATGNGSNFIRADFAGELFGKGQLLEASRY
jgi:homoserine O-acetyltransferase